MQRDFQQRLVTLIDLRTSLLTQVNEQKLDLAAEIRELEALEKTSTSKQRYSLPLVRNATPLTPNDIGLVLDDIAD